MEQKDIDSDLAKIKQMQQHLDVITKNVSLLLHAIKAGNKKGSVALLREIHNEYFHFTRIFEEFSNHGKYVVLNTCCLRKHATNVTGRWANQYIRFWLGSSHFKNFFHKQIWKENLNKLHFYNVTWETEWLYMLILANAAVRK